MKSIEEYEQMAREAKRECSHASADHLMPGQRAFSGATGAPFTALIEQLRCIDCGAWLSLGEANDTLDALVELRAAEIVALVIVDRLSISYDLRESPNDEYDGWQGWPTQSVDLERPDHAAGWLAREIYVHDVDGALA